MTTWAVIADYSEFRGETRYVDGFVDQRHAHRFAAKHVREHPFALTYVGTSASIADLVSSMSIPNHNPEVAPPLTRFERFCRWFR